MSDENYTETPAPTYQDARAKFRFLIERVDAAEAEGKDFLLFVVMNTHIDDTNFNSFVLRQSVGQAAERMIADEATSEDRELLGGLQNSAFVEAVKALGPDLLVQKLAEASAIASSSDGSSDE